MADVLIKVAGLIVVGIWAVCVPIWIYRLMKAVETIASHKTL